LILWNDLMHGMAPNSEQAKTALTNFEHLMAKISAGMNIWTIIY